MNRLEVLIRSLQEHRASALAEIFHGPCTVYLGDDDITIAGIGAALDEEHIARQDAGVDHRMAVDLEDIRRFLVADEVLIERHRIGEFLVGRRGKTCRDCAEDRQVRTAWSRKKPVHRGMGTGGEIDQTLNVRTDGMVGAQSGESHELTVAWHTLRAPGKGPHRLQLWVELYTK